MSGDNVSAAIDWLEFALVDLEAARSRPNRHALPRHVAYHAQQAVEKALKAALVLEGLDPPKVHDLDELRNLLPAGWRVTKRPASGRRTAGDRGLGATRSTDHEPSAAMTA